MRSTLAVLVLVGGLIAGCDTEQKMGDRSTDYGGTPVSRGGPKEDWNSLQTDPVCDMIVNPKTAVASEYYGGKLYYFDSEDCWHRFHMNPQAFVPGNPEEQPVREAK
jgi:YHS domain-containing protein